MTLGCGQGGSCCGACQGSARQFAVLTAPLTLDGLGSGRLDGLGKGEALHTAATAVNAIWPGVGTAIETFVSSEVKPLPPITVDEEQMARVVDGLAQQGLYVPSSVSGLPEDPSIFAAFGEQHKTLVTGVAGGLALLLFLRR